MRRATPSLAELLDLCAAHGIRSRLPYSQLEAEAVWRGVDTIEVIRAYLLSRLEEMGVLREWMNEELPEHAL